MDSQRNDPFISISLGLGYQEREIQGIQEKRCFLSQTLAFNFLFNHQFFEAGAES